MEKGWFNILWPTSWNFLTKDGFFWLSRVFDTGFWSLTIAYSIHQKVICIEADSHLTRKPLHSLGWVFQNRLLFSSIILSWEINCRFFHSVGLGIRMGFPVCQGVSWLSNTNSTAWLGGRIRLAQALQLRLAREYLKTRLKRRHIKPADLV